MSWKKQLLEAHAEYSERNGLSYCKNCGIDHKELVDILSKVEAAAYKEGMDNKEEIDYILVDQAYEKAAKVAEENGNVMGKMIANSIRSLKT